jgi:protein-disulfide isomerase
MTRPLRPILVTLLLVLATAALAAIGQTPNTILTALEERGAAIAETDGTYLGTLGLAAQPGVSFVFEERGEVVFRVVGEASVFPVAGDPGAAFLAELIGASTVYREQLVEPVRGFFETRLGELAGQGPVALGVEEYLLTLTVQGAGQVDAPFRVSFVLELQQIAEDEFPEASHSLGPADARYVIREFSDFQCPFCANFNSGILPQIEAAIAAGEGRWGQVRFEFHHFPLQSIHANALLAAEASECVTAQNTPEAFWSFHDALFEFQAAWQSLGDPAPYFVRLTQELGLESSGLAACLNERTFLPLVERAYRAATGELRLSGTPTVFLNGFKVRDYLTLAGYEELFDQIDRFALP